VEACIPSQFFSHLLCLNGCWTLNIYVYVPSFLFTIVFCAPKWVKGKRAKHGSNPEDVVDEERRLSSVPNLRWRNAQDEHCSQCKARDSSYEAKGLNLCNAQLQEGIYAY
jgi:hypothetical protein